MKNFIVTKFLVVISIIFAFLLMRELEFQTTIPSELCDLTKTIQYLVSIIVLGILSYFSYKKEKEEF